MGGGDLRIERDVAKLCSIPASPPPTFAIKGEAFRRRKQTRPVSWPGHRNILPRRPLNESPHATRKDAPCKSGR